jgi:hypothetical protein
VDFFRLQENAAEIVFSSFPNSYSPTSIQHDTCVTYIDEYVLLNKVSNKEILTIMKEEMYYLDKQQLGYCATFRLLGCRYK